MAYQLSEINHKIQSDPVAFLEESDAAFQEKINKTADRILQHRQHSSIVLLSGPSGSGKTTSAMKLRDALEQRGVRSHSIAMDDYFQTVDPRTSPRTPEGEIDLESPLCLDIQLLEEHFQMLEAGETILVPKYEFSRQMRVVQPTRRLRLGKDEIVIFEGIHALNDMITDRAGDAFKLFVSARSEIKDGDRLLVPAHWVRLMRRTVRDYLFRGADAAQTMAMWPNVRRGERKYITPFKHKADLSLDTTHPYEVSVLCNRAAQLFPGINTDNEHYEEVHDMLRALGQFLPIDHHLVRPDALLREFIGGGIYEY